MKWKVTERGAQVIVDVWRENSGAGLFKAYIVGAAGRFPLGTLLPEGDRLHLRRALSVDGLKRQGFWPIRQIGEELVYSFRRDSETIEWKDEILRRSARCLPRHTVSRNGGVVSFVFRFDPREAFPFVPAFCFARVENGRLIFSFCQDGTPYIPSKKGNDRGEVGEQRREQYGKSDDQGTQRTGGPAGL